MSSESETPYDVVMYPGRAYHEPHPDRLSTMGALYGMQPALAARCRVFELGCGFGGHLMPMAYQYPESHFVGIDLSSRSIAHGQRIAAELGLKNLELRHANVMDISPADGEFDYILAHGVYAWVPDPVREKMMSIFKQNLAPQGVVYVSYNAHPGSHLRNLVRDMMNFHVRNTADPELRVKQARAIMNFFADAVANDTVHGSIVRAERDRIRKMADEVLFHDDLDLGSRAFLLHEVVGAAQKHGLQYLCDATLHRRELIYYPDKVKMIFENFTDEEFMERDQYHDFVDGHGFRRTLLCHDDVKLDRKVDASAMQRFYFASQLAPVSKRFQLTMPGSADFKPPTGNTLTTDHLLSKAAILCLAERWPAAVGFAQVMEEASKLAASVGAPPSEYDIVTLAGTLLRAVSCGHMDLHFTPPPLATTISERPVASAVARQQAAHKMPLTNLRQRTIVLDDEIGRQFLMLVDGTRTIDQLVFDLADRVEKAGLAQKDKPITRGDVEHQLRGLVRLAMIIG